MYVYIYIYIVKGQNELFSSYKRLELIMYLLRDTLFE